MLHILIGNTINKHIIFVNGIMLPIHETCIGHICQVHRSTVVSLTPCTMPHPHSIVFESGANVLIWTKSNIYLHVYRKCKQT